MEEKIRISNRLNVTSVQNLVGSVRGGLRGFSSANMVTAISTVTGIGFDADSDKALFLARAESVVRDRIGEVHEVDSLVKIMRSLWLLGHRPVLDDNALVEAVAVQALRHIEGFKPASIAAITHSLALLKVRWEGWYEW